MNVLITGASGFVGADLTKKLLDEGYSVYAQVRDKKRFAEHLAPNDLRRVEILEGDFLVKADLEKFERELRDRVGSLDIVVHLVGGGPLSTSQKTGVFDRNYKTTSNLIQVLETSKKLGSLSLFIYFSSLAAMGVPDGAGNRIVYDEAAACNPVLPYERAKFETEVFLKDVATKSKFKVVVLRLPQIYGPADPTFMQMVSLIRKGIFPVVRGKVGSLPLINLRDVVGATLTVVQNPHRIPDNYEVYLICEGSYSYSRLADLVHRKFGKGGTMRVPYLLMYLGTFMIESMFGILGKPEPLNRRRLVSLTKDRIVNSSKFTNAFEFKFQENVESFIANRL
jgi:nucleoside-diphosphate-sugar epimerase